MKSSWTFNALQLHLHDEHAGSDTTWQNVLSAAERSRAMGMASAARAHTFMSARAYLRQHIAALTGLAPGMLDIIIPPSGKPYLARPAETVSFSISHSHGKILIGLMLGVAAVGVDLQFMDDSVDIERIAARFFNDAENAILATTPPPMRREKAFAIWCQKEAQFKIGDDTPAAYMTTENIGANFMLAAGYR